jgi:serine phosphatase RsbU (regulator of sigma subunit)
LPQAPGIEFATRFVPAEEGVGGDWYDAFVLDDGALWVMTGDVAGHGLEAAITMGRLRAALRAYALEGNGPARVLELADRKFQLFDPDHMATVVCALLKPPYDHVELASAGHPPPLVAVPGEATTFVDVAPGPPLGVPGGEPPTLRLELPVGSLLFFYTDGLVERRGESLETGLNLLASVVAADAPEAVCREVMRRLVGSEQPADDIAVLVLRRAVDTHTG